MATIGYTLIATTNRDQFQRLNEQIRPLSNEPTKGIFYIDSRKPKGLGDLLYRSIQLRFPTHALGQVSDITSKIADHVYFCAPDMNFYDRLLLPRGASKQTIRQRFRRWSQRLHPDRFVERRNGEPHLAGRMEAVYTLLSDTYRSLMDPVACGIHQYWLQRHEPRYATSLHHSNLIKKALSVTSEPITQAQLILALSLQDIGKWDETERILADLVKKHPANKSLKIWRETCTDIQSILAK